ncbi:MAG: hypothetical protein OXN92_14835 [Gammaproteobacteria bacterium]|nr:hypothetical protein [Gammaproteobacteria bacterium]
MPAVAALALLAAGCVNPFAPSRDSMLEIFVGSKPVWVQLSSRDTTMVQLVNGLDDPKGFAGLEIIVSAEDMPTRRYTASHFASVDETKFKVPETGFATVTARVVQDDRIVAEVSERWGLGPELQWDIDVERAPYPGNEGFLPDPENPECQWFWCAFIWRSPIADGAANYEGEALWVVLYRHDPDECLDDCPWP